MKISAYSLSPTGFRILLIGLVCCLIGAAAGFVLMLLPTTYERLEAVSQIMSVTLRGLVVTVLATVVADVIAKKEK